MHIGKENRDEELFRSEAAVFLTAMVE